MSMTLIESKTLVSAQSSIEFTSIPQTFTDLLIVSSLRNGSVNADGGGQFSLEINDVSTSTYSFRRLQGDGSSASSYAETSTLIAGYNFINGVNSTANTFSNGSIYIPNYSGSTQKSLSFDNVYENNGTTARQHLYAALWANTAAITKLEFISSGYDFVVGSSISLYGITKGSDGIVTTS